MTGSLGLFWIIGTFHITNFDSEGINIGNFLSRTILILWIENFLLVKKVPKMDIFGFSIV